MPRLFADFIKNEQPGITEPPKKDRLFADFLEPPTEKPTTNGTQPKRLFADFLEEPKTEVKHQTPGPFAKFDGLGLAKQLFGTVKAQATFGMSLLEPGAIAASIPKTLGKLVKPAAEPIERAIQIDLEESRRQIREPLQNWIEGIARVEPRFGEDFKEPSKLAMGARAIAETIEENAPLSITEAATFYAGGKVLGASTRYGLAEVAKMAPRKVLAALMPISKMGGASEAIDRAGQSFTQRFEKEFGFKVAANRVEEFKDFYAEQIVRRILKLSPSTRMNPKIYAVEEAKRLPRPGTALEPAKTGQGLPPEPTEPPVAAGAPEVITTPKATPTQELAGIGVIPGEVPTTVPLPMAQTVKVAPEIAEAEPSPINVPGTEIGPKHGFEAVKKMSEAGELELDTDQKSFLDKMEAFWNFYPEAETGIVQADGTISPKMARPVTTPEPELDITPTPEIGEAESIVDQSGEGNLANLTPEQFSRRFPNAPPEAHKEIVKSSLLSGKGASDEALAAHPDLGMEFEPQPEKVTTPLQDFVRKRGGIDMAKAKPYLGDLENVRSLLRQKGGLSVSEMAEIAHQSGLIKNYSEREFIDALDKEARLRSSGGKMGVGISSERLPTSPLFEGSIVGETPSTWPSGPSPSKRHLDSFNKSITEHPIFVKTHDEAMPVIKAEAEKVGADPRDVDFIVKVYGDNHTKVHDLFDEYTKKNPSPARKTEIRKEMDEVGIKEAAIIRFANIAAFPKDWIEHYERLGRGETGLTAPKDVLYSEKYLGKKPEGGEISERKTSYGKPTSTPEFKKWFGESKVVDKNGQPIVVYHGSGNAESIAAKGFSPDFIAKGQDQFGSGFYFTNQPNTASGYTTHRLEPELEKLGGETSPAILPVYLSIKKPIIVRGKPNLRESITASPIQVRKLILKAPNIKNPDGPLSNWGDIRHEGFDSVLNKAIAAYADNVIALANDIYPGEARQFLKAVNSVFGYDGVIAEFENGEKHYVAWFPEQIKSATGNVGAFNPKSANIVEESKIAFGGDADTAIEEAAQKIGQLEFDFDASDMPSSGIADRLQKKGFVDYRGTKIENARQAAEVAAVFRNPKIEHFQVLIIKKGVLVAHQVISSGMPDAAVIPLRFKYQIQSAIKRLGADSFYIAHNHPSGNPSPSMEDRRLSLDFRNKFEDSYKGHVVIDDKQFALINSGGEFSLFDFEKPKTPFRHNEPFATSPAQAVAAASKYFDTGKNLAIVFNDARLRVLAVESIRSDANIQEYMRQKIVGHGAAGAILIHPLGWAPTSTEKFPNRLVDIIAVNQQGVSFSMKIHEPNKLDTIRNPGDQINKMLSEGPGFYRVQEEAPQYGSEEFKAITALTGIKPGTELTLRRPIMDPAIKGGKITKGTRVKVVDVDQDGQFLLIQHGQNYTTARIEDFIETRPVSQAPQKAPPVKQRIAESTGLVQDDIIRKMKDMELLKMKLKAMEKGANIGARAGVRRGQAIMLDRLRYEGQKISDVKKGVIEFVEKNLPTSERGKYLRMVASAETNRDLAKTFARVVDHTDRLYKKSLISDIRKLTDKAMDSGAVAVEYKTKIKDLLSDIDLGGRTEKTREKLLKIQEFISDQEIQGVSVDLPKYLVERLSILARRPINHLSEFELERILNDLSEVVATGRKFQESREALYLLKRDNIKTEILKGTKPIETSPKLYAKPGEALSLQQRYANFTAKASNFAQEMDLSIMQMDVAFDILDGSPGYTGPNFVHFKKRLDGDWARFSDRLKSHEDPIRSLIEKYKFNDRNLERIGVHADRIQPGGRQRLKESRGLADQDIDAIVLTAQELEVYLKMRATFDKTLPDVKKKMAELYNQSVGDVPNYFPYIRDLEMMSEHPVEHRVIDAITGQFARTKTTEKGFTKERVGGAKVPMVLNAWDRFSAHMRDVSYFVEMQGDIKMLFEIANSPEYAQAAGDLGRKMVLDWLDLMARSGGVDGARKLRILDILRNNLGSALLGFRLSSILVQPTALFDGAAFIGGGNVMSGLTRVLGQKEFRNFMYNNMPELRARVGDDPSFAEKGWFPGIQQAGFFPLQFVDSITAAAVSGGAYLQMLDQLGIPLDLSTPVPEALEYATVILRRSQASPLFKDLGLAMSRGNVIGNRSVSKAIFQFQTFTLGRWSHFRYDIPRLFRNGDPAAAARMASYLILATMAETGIRRASNAAIAAALVGLGLTLYAKEDQDPFYKDVLFNMLDPIPFVGSLIRGGMYGSYPIPVLNPLRDLGVSVGRVVKYRSDVDAIRGATKAVESLAGLTGIPGLSQIAQIVRIAIEGRTLPFPYSSELMSLRQKRKLGKFTPKEEKRFFDLRQAESEMGEYKFRFKSAIANGNNQAAKREAEAALNAMRQYK